MKVLGGHKAHDLILSVWTKLVTMRRTVSGGLSCRLVPVDVRWSAEGKAQAIAETQAPDASAGFGAMSISIARSWNRFFEPVGDFTVMLDVVRSPEGVIVNLIFAPHVASSTELHVRAPASFKATNRVPLIVGR
jgi:hypothetical protein